MRPKGYSDVLGSGVAQLAPLAGHAFEALSRTNDGAVTALCAPVGARIIRGDHKNGSEPMRHGDIRGAFAFARSVNGKALRR
jgi:hypothetical protein